MTAEPDRAIVGRVHITFEAPTDTTDDQLRKAAIEVLEDMIDSMDALPITRTAPAEPPSPSSRLPHYILTGFAGWFTAFAMLSFLSGDSLLASHQIVIGATLFYLIKRM